MTTYSKTGTPDEAFLIIQQVSDTVHHHLIIHVQRSEVTVELTLGNAIHLLWKGSQRSTC